MKVKELSWFSGPRKTRRHGYPVRYKKKGDLIDSYLA
jgi:hypothetical protein